MKQVQRTVINPVDFEEDIAATEMTLKNHCNESRRKKKKLRNSI
jgi:hypothetical protein